MRADLPGFRDAWAKACRVPGFFSEASAVAFFTVVRDLRPQVVVEIGSYLGMSSIFLAESLRVLGVEGARVHAVDPHTGDRQQLEGLGGPGEMSAQAALFLDHLRLTETDDIVEPHVEPSVVAAASWSGPIDLLYVDGWHSYDAVREDGAAWLPHLREGGVVVFDDYARYADVRRAVDDLAADGQVALWGSVFGQAFGGRSGTAPSPGVAHLLERTNTPLLRRVHRPAG